MNALSGPGSGADYAYCGTELRRDDLDRWLACLFIPEAKRRHAHALYAFSLEVARVSEIVSQPMPGLIRLQWWRDALERPDDGDVRANPVAAALADTIQRFNLPKSAFMELIDAREFDLFDEPMETIEALEGYAKATSSGLFRMSSMIVAAEQSAACVAAAETGGVAYALTGLLRALPWHSARGQIFIPLEILRKHGLSRADIAAHRPTPAILAAIADLRGLAQKSLDSFFLSIEGLPDSCRTAFLPVSLCESYLRQMEKPGYDPFKTRVTLPQWRRQWILWRAAKNWG
jgi:15-cis-phytoene synthase